jgi:20S proteasome alpha/beta subunit
MAESLWEPNLEPEDLFETISQTLLNAADRDAYSVSFIIFSLAHQHHSDRVRFELEYRDGERWFG